MFFITALFRFPISLIEFQVVIQFFLHFNFLIECSLSLYESVLIQFVVLMIIGQAIQYVRIAIMVQVVCLRLMIYPYILQRITQFIIILVIQHAPLLLMVVHLEFLFIIEYFLRSSILDLILQLIVVQQ